MERVNLVTKNDFIVQPFKGSGPGGQHRNKNATAIRIIHPESGARAESQQYKSQVQNRKAAFERLVKTDKFQRWIRIKKARVLFGEVEIERRLKEVIRPENLKVERWNSETGKWEGWE